MTKKQQKTDKSDTVALSESDLEKAEGGAMQVFVKTLTGPYAPVLKNTRSSSTDE